MVNTAYALLLLGAAAAATGTDAATSNVPAPSEPARTIELVSADTPSVNRVLEAIQVEIETDLQDRMRENIATALTDVRVTEAVALNTVEK
ncbi:MAG: hypothetical protein QNJ40_17845 [Xanthomonadales bacterium]|nr:hypothetical protein [Xanthomonadales bacterium]